ncbi:MAG: hypothetical protein DDT19_00022 [Syntrophomonadaceae bacterium]|nr:hypothetical protein [Bacillota bacterium]
MKKRTIVVVAIVSCVLLLFASTAHSIAVAVANYPVLTKMLQQLVVQPINNMLMEIQQKLEGIKKSPGSIGKPVQDAISRDIKMINRERITSMGNLSASYGRDFGAFAEVEATDPSGKWNQVINNPTKQVFNLPQPKDGNFQAYKDTVDKQTVIVAGPPRKTSKRQWDDTGTAAKADIVESDLYRSQSARSYTVSAYAYYQAEKMSKNLDKIQPSKIDSAYSDQAVKDIAKLAYFNAIIASKQLKVSAHAEMRKSLRH